MFDDIKLTAEQKRVSGALRAGKAIPLIIGFLKQHAAKPTIKHQYIAMAAYFAAYTGNTDLLKALFDNKLCDEHVRIRDELTTLNLPDSQCLLFVAAQQKHFNLVKYLHEEQGFKLDVIYPLKTADGMKRDISLLHVAVACGGYYVSMYIAEKIGVEAKTNYYSHYQCYDVTAVQIATALGYSAISNMLDIIADKSKAIVSKQRLPVKYNDKPTNFRVVLNKASIRVSKLEQNRTTNKFAVIVQQPLLEVLTINPSLLLRKKLPDLMKLGFNGTYNREYDLDDYKRVIRILVHSIAKCDADITGYLLQYFANDILQNKDSRNKNFSKYFFHHQICILIVHCYRQLTYGYHLNHNKKINDIYNYLVKNKLIEPNQILTYSGKLGESNINPIWGTLIEQLIYHHGELRISVDLNKTSNTDSAIKIKEFICKLTMLFKCGFVIDDPVAFTNQLNISKDSLVTKLDAMLHEFVDAISKLKKEKSSLLSNPWFDYLIPKLFASYNEYIIYRKFEASVDSMCSEYLPRFTLKELSEMQSLQNEIFTSPICEAHDVSVIVSNRECITHSGSSSLRYDKIQGHSYMDDSSKQVDAVSTKSMSAETFCALEQFIDPELMRAYNNGNVDLVREYIQNMDPNKLVTNRFHKGSYSIYTIFKMHHYDSLCALMHNEATLIIKMNILAPIEEISALKGNSVTGRFNTELLIDGERHDYLNLFLNYGRNILDMMEPDKVASGVIIYYKCRFKRILNNISYIRNAGMYGYLRLKSVQSYQNIEKSKMIDDLINMIHRLHFAYYRLTKMNNNDSNSFVPLTIESYYGEEPQNYSTSSNSNKPTFVSNRPIQQNNTPPIINNVVKSNGGSRNIITVPKLPSNSRNHSSVVKYNKIPNNSIQRNTTGLFGGSTSTIKNNKTGEESSGRGSRGEMVDSTVGKMNPMSFGGSMSTITESSITGEESNGSASRGEMADSTVYKANPISFAGSWSTITNSTTGGKSSGRDSRGVIVDSRKHKMVTNSFGISTSSFKKRKIDRRHSGSDSKRLKVDGEEYQINTNSKRW